jgi:phthiocerol/phenolphthiocerol synthesis type-I polyketide synthase E
MRGTLEFEIANIWREILGLQDVALHEDFFELGGTSLHAARVVTKTRAAFGVKLSAQTLFEHPTLAAFAVKVSAAQALKASA